MGRPIASLILLLLFLLPAPAVADAPPGAGEIVLGVGAQRVLTVPQGIERLSIGDPEVADVKPLGRDQVLVLAGKPGRTTLLFFSSGVVER